MKLSNVYDDLDRLVLMYTGKFADSINMEREDLYQELWVCLLERDVETLQLANRVLRNKAIDLYRRTHSKFNAQFTEPYMCVTRSFEDSEEREVYTISSYSIDHSFELDLSSYMIESLLSVAKGRERKYIVVRFYLSAGVSSLYSEYSKIVSDLTEEQRKDLYVAKTDVQREDCIAKYIFGYKSRNSSPYREMRVRVRDLYRSLM